MLDNLTRAARQHAANAMNAWRPPKLEVTQNRRMMRLPDATPALDRVRRGGFGDEITRLAENVLDGQYRILGRDFTLTAPLPWRRDLLNGASEASPLAYYQRVPAFEGDLRLSRELNRHQHLVLLAQAWMLSHEARFIDEILRQLADWREANPLNRGVHWTSPLEVALRALSWIWIDHLVGAEMPAEARHQLVEGIFHHALHLEHNLDSAIAAIALHAIAATYQQMPGAERWAPIALQMIEARLPQIVYADGSYASFATAEQVFALDLVVLHYVFAGRPAHLHATIERMASYLHILMGPARRLPFLGDADCGRVFHPYGAMEEWGRATLATCSRILGKPEWLASMEDMVPQAAWWLGETAFAASTGFAKPSSRVFAHSGISILQRGKFWLAMDGGPLTTAESHADTLSVMVRVGDTDILIDAGTNLRDAASHNTIRVDGRNHTAEDAVQMGGGERMPEFERVAGSCVTGGTKHMRSVELTDAGLEIHDIVELPPGEHVLEQYWYPGLPAIPLSPSCYRIGPYAEITFRTPGSTIAYDYSARATAYGATEETPVLCISWRGTGRAEFRTSLTLA